MCVTLGYNWLDLMLGQLNKFWRKNSSYKIQISFILKPTWRKIIFTNFGGLIQIILMRATKFQHSLLSREVSIMTSTYVLLLKIILYSKKKLNESIHHVFNTTIMWKSSHISIKHKLNPLAKPHGNKVRTPLIRGAFYVCVWARYFQA